MFAVPAFRASFAGLPEVAGPPHIVGAQYRLRFASNYLPVKNLRDTTTTSRHQSEPLAINV
jgi:hypothetical protein